MLYFFDLGKSPVMLLGAVLSGGANTCAILSLSGVFLCLVQIPADTFFGSPPETKPWHLGADASELQPAGSNTME